MTPPSPISNDTDAGMADVELGKKAPAITITAMDPPVRPVLGRRRTTTIDGGGLTHARTLTYDGKEDALTKVGNFFWRIYNANILTRYSMYILPVAALLAIPVVLTDTVYHDANAGSIRLLGLFIWIEMIWVGLWICKLIATALPVLFQAACGLISTGVRKYSIILMALEIPVSLFLWTVFAYATIPVVCVFNSKDQCHKSWVHDLDRGIKALIVVAAVFLAEKTFVEIVSINYHRKQYHHKIKESKKMVHMLDHLYDASRALFPEFCAEFRDDDADIQGNTLSDVRKHLAQRGIHTQVFSDMGRVRDKVAAAFGAMASDITGKRVFSTTSAHSVVVEALETERASKALARRLWLSFVGEGQDVLYKQDLVEVLEGRQSKEEAEEIFNALDRDSNGDVSLEEMTMLVHSIGQERKNRAQSVQDISEAIAVLDRLLTLIVFVAIAFIYATFFSPTFAANTKQLWTTFTGVGFAIGGTVTEFLACCIFLFIKHPYDVGDRVDISDQELVVQHIGLMYSVFRRVDSNKKVQIPHAIANTLWIENVSRSKQMKERLSLNVDAATSMQDVLALKHELNKFVNAPENRRDFQQELDIELLSLNDLSKLELRVEIRHKSNFANDKLRNARRNKFMVELLAATRRIPINPPGGSGPPLGDPSNPSYSVAVSDKEAEAFRAHHHMETKAARLYPSGPGLASLLPDVVSSGLQNPAAAMIAGMTARRNGSMAEGAQRYGSVAEGVSRTEEIWPKR